MSGAYGWGGKDRSADYDGSSSGGFSRAIRAYDPHPVYRRYDPDPPSRAAIPATPRASISFNPRGLTIKSEAANVLVVCQDVTGSMAAWIDEIFDRLPLLYGETQKYLGDDLEILFIAFGDEAFGDPIQVTRFGRGKVLDYYLTTINRHCDGGGNGVESPEVVAYYIVQNVDTSSARNVYFYFVTDEGIPDQVKPGLINHGLGVAISETPSTKGVMDNLLLRGNVFAVLAKTHTFERCQPPRTWGQVLSPERLLILDDSRRVVDVMLAVMAKTTGQYAQFTADLKSRQGGTQHGEENIANVHQTIALVNDGSPKSPTIKAGTRRLLPGPDDKA